MVQRNIVVLGASFAGINTSHYILKHVIPKLPTSSTNDTFHLYLLNPSPEFYHTVSSPRGILNDKLIPESSSFWDIKKGFEQYGNRFTLIQGVAIGIDTAGRSVRYNTKGGEKSLEYHALIIATGAAQPSPLFAPGPTTVDTRDALKKFRAALPSAQTIVIGGGGPVAVEAAGEIGEYLNGTAGLCQSRPSQQKARVIVVTAGSKLLPILREDVAKRAEKYLNRVGVDVTYNAKVESVSPSSAGLHSTSVVTEKGQKVSVTLATGEVLEADIYIPAVGTKPNSSFVPDTLLDSTGRVKTTSELRVEGAGPRVYAIGDVASVSPGGILNIQSMVPVLATNLKRDLAADLSDKSAPATGKDRNFESDPCASQIVPIGRGKGVGQIFGWWTPSLFVSLIKGRDYMTSMTPKLMDGSNVLKESVWKFE